MRKYMFPIIEVSMSPLRISYSNWKIGQFWMINIYILGKPMYYFWMVHNVDALFSYSIIGIMSH